MHFIFDVLRASWQMLLDSSVYMLFGLLAGGLLKVFLPPDQVVRHLGQGRFSSVFKAALFGIPLPICSCGVLPVAASLKKQGANNGATAAFLISTPESGVDSISISYALLDPLMTIARPVAAFISAVAAGLTENMLNPPAEKPSLPGPVAASPSETGHSLPPAIPAPAPCTLGGRVSAGIRYALGDLWGDIAVWFLFGILLGGIITAVLPDDFIASYLGGGFSAMLIMLAVGIPIYICATASTPIAAALILKGVSPGAALVFLLVGPATNMATLTVLTRLLGRNPTLRYLAILAGSAVLCGVLLDLLYGMLNLSARAVVGQAAEVVPYWVQLGGTLLLLILSIRPVSAALGSLAARFRASGQSSSHSCGCADGTETNDPLHNFKGS